MVHHGKDIFAVTRGVLIRYGREEFARGTVQRKRGRNTLAVMRDVTIMLLGEEFVSGMVQRGSKGFAVMRDVTTKYR